MSIYERFKKRKQIDLIVDVKFPLSEPEFVFKIHRFSQAEHDQALFKAQGILKEKNITRENTDAELYTSEANSTFFYCLADYIKRHVKTWEHLAVGEKLAFNAANLETLFETFSITDRVEISVAFLLACMEADKKKEGVSPESDLSKPLLSE